MIFPDACDPLVMDYHKDESIPWRHIHNHNAINSGGTFGISLSGTGSGRNAGVHTTIYSTTSTWDPYDPVYGNEKAFAFWNGTLPEKIDLPLGNENEWSDYIHEQYGSSVYDKSFDDSNRGAPLAGSAIMFTLGSVMAGIFFWGNKRHAVSKSGNRRDIQHRCER